jgi:hypothetical protein
MAKQKNMVIYFNDGTKTAFDFPQQQEDLTTLISRIEKVLTMPYFCIESEGAVLLYPVTSIKSIQIYPAPKTLPSFVIKGATLVDTY